MSDLFWIMQGDCRAHLEDIGNAVVDTVVTDPPYDLTQWNGAKKGFMDAKWDGTGIAFDPTFWAQILRVMKPGGHLFAFGATRTYHKLAAAVEVAGFEIRDTIHWTYLQGFPKSTNISLAIDKAAGVQGHRGKRFAMVGGEHLPNPQGFEKYEPKTDEAKAWAGWGTALRATHELILVARKPCKGTTTGNVLQYGTGALNVDGARSEGGMWPTNTLVTCPCDTGEVCSPQIHRSFPVLRMEKKPAGEERKESDHPTLKPVALMKWLIELGSRESSIVLDPFMGSGTTGVAALQAKRMFVGMELEEKFYKQAERRLRTEGGNADGLHED